MHCYENQCHGRTARIPILSYAARNPISIRHELRTSLRLRSSPDRFNNTQLDEASIDRASQPALQSKELELLGKPTALVPNQVQDDSKRGAGDAVSAPYLDYFSSRATPGEELDEWEPIKEVQTGEQDVEVQFYEPKVGDLVVGVVVSGNANRLDINIGSDVLATMLSKEVLPLYDAEMERLLCEIPRESNAEAEGSLFAPGKMGIVRNEEALSPGPGPGRPVVEMGTVLSAEVLGRTLSGKPLLSSRRFSRRIAWHRVRQIKQLNEPIDVHILEWNTGGLITRIEGLRAFLPKTELVNKPFDNFAALKANLGRQTSVLISRVDEANGELVVSEREAWDRKYLCEGTLLEGTIRRLFSYGAQVRVDGTSVSGLLHVTNISRARVPSVRDLFSEGEKVKVMVIRSMFTNKICFSTADLESEHGLILTNKERVFDEAEQMAAAYRRKLSSVLSMHEINIPPDDVNESDNEAECYANWSWFKFETESEL